MKNIFQIIVYVFLFYHVLFAQTNKSGDIDGENWTSDNSPYIITGDIKILDLTIGPGVHVQFDGNHKFEIDGILQAGGFHGDSIYFELETPTTNRWAGMTFNSGSTNSYLRYCRIEGSRQDGIYIDQTEPEISNCRIIENSGNGLYLKSTTIQLNHCIIEHNGSSGILTEGANLTIENSIISHNAGAGISSTISEDQINLINIVISDNLATGIDCPDGNLIIRNSIIYYNDGQINSQDINTDVSFSDIQGSPVYEGTGNINTDPQFIDRHSYTLSSSSACIDSGSTNSSYNDVFFPPSLGSYRNDMGAYGGPLAFLWYPPLYIKPQHYDFGRVTQDSTHSTILNILNYRDTDLNVSGIFFEGDDANVYSRNRNNFSVDVYDSTDLTLSFTPVSESVYPANLIFQTQNHGTVSFPINGEGVLPRISLSQSELDFDTVNLGDSLSIDLIVQNSGGDSLRINITPPSSSVFQNSQSQLTVNPDSSSDTIRVTFNPDSVKSYQDSLIINCNDRNQPQIVIPLSGTGSGPLINILPEHLDFGYVRVSFDTSFTVTLENAGNNSLEIFNLFIEQPDSIEEAFSIVDEPSAYPFVIEPDNFYEIEIAFKPQNRVPMEGLLYILSSDPFRDSISVSLSGQGLSPEINLSSSEIEFGGAYIDSESIRPLMIENVGNIQLRIEEPQIISADTVFSLDMTGFSFPFYLDPDSSLQLPVKYTPADTVQSNGQLRIVSDDPVQHEVYIALSGFGVSSYSSPMIELSTASIDFGGVDTISYSQDDIYIYNNGGATLIIPEDSIYTTNSPSGAFSIMDISGDIHIESDDSLGITLRFNPPEAGPTEGVLNISSNDPLNPLLTVQLTGTGLVDQSPPQIQISTTALEFGEIDTSISIQQSFHIFNKGFGDLIIPVDSIYIIQSPAPVFSLSDLSDDILIIPQDSLQINIRFKPSDLGLMEGILKIKSNDPLNPDLEVFLSGTGVASGFVPQIEVSKYVLEYNRVDTSSFALQSFHIYNRGQETLIIPRDSLYITDSAYESFSIENITTHLSISPQDSQEVIIRFAPQEQGPDQANLWIKSNDPTTPTMIVLLSGIGVGNGASTISSDIVNTTDPLINGQPATLSFRIESFIPIDSAFVYARKGGEATYSPFHLHRQGETLLWSAEIDSTFITEQGLEYYVHVNQGMTKSVFPDTGDENPIAVTVRIPYMKIPGQIPAKTYQMISLPFSTNDQDLGDLFVDNLGIYNPSIYRIFECRDGNGYTEISDMDRPLPPGQSVWLISKEAVDLDVHDGESVTTGSDYALQLRSGWNMISTPFAFPVSWLHLNTNLGLRYYDGNDWPFAAILEPYKGYAVYAPEDTMIQIPAIRTSVSKSLPKSAFHLNEEGWYIQLIAESEEASDKFNYVGSTNAAKSGYDRFDHPEPPPVGNYISLYLILSEEDKKLSIDFRPSGSDGYKFDFKLKSNLKHHKEIRLIPHNLPEEFEWIITSEQTKMNYGQQSIKTSLTEVRYQLIVGNSEYLNQLSAEFKSVPEVFRLAQNYPNPFNPSTMINYELPNTSHVELSIYNILGQKVKILVSERQETGYHQIEWDASGYASGVYYYRIQAGEFQDVKKMVLIQ